MITEILFEELALKQARTSYISSRQPFNGD